MKRVLRKEKSGYALGLAFCIIGLVLIAIALWKAWPSVSVSQNLFSDLWSYLLTEQLDLGLGVGFKLMYFTILGAAMFLVGVVVLVFSRKWFTLSGEIVLLKCPYCKNSWRARQAKGWAECPHCRQFVQPQVTKRS